METIDIFRNLWFLLIGVLFMGYSIFDGFDFGAGVLIPFISRDDKDKKILIDAIWPFWDGNEVWLVAGAGALFAAFPLAYSYIRRFLSSVHADFVFSDIQGSIYGVLVL